MSIRHYCTHRSDFKLLASRFQLAYSRLVPGDFHYLRRVQFHETDLAGMVHFSWYFKYMEEAEHALWRAAGLTIAAGDDTIRFPRVNASCDYRAPLRFEDEIDVAVVISAIGSRT